MQIPFFYTAEAGTGQEELELDEATSRHVVSVLRMAAGEAIHLTDGMGNLLTTVIEEAHKKKCRVRITGRQTVMQDARNIAIAISPLKSPVRFEWFLEKATEIGVTTIFPVICQRTEKQHFRMDRMKSVLISALLQSRQAWLPVLHPPASFENIVAGAGYTQKFIAHCLEDDKQPLQNGMINTGSNQLVLIGPEGDFTATEISQAMENQFMPVSLGKTRLRTETAGMVAAVLLKYAPM